MANWMHQLDQVRHDFEKENIHHESFEVLTSMIFSLQNSIEHLDLCRFEKSKQKRMLEEIEATERLIQRYMYKCKMILLSQSQEPLVAAPGTSDN